MFCNYFSQKSDNLLRIAFFGSMAKLVHKNRAGPENCQNSFQSMSYDILLPITFRMLLIQIKLKGLFTVSVYQ